MSTTNTASGFWGNRSRISWGAILAGVVTALATTVLLSLLGAALGAGSIHALDATTNDLSNYGTGAAIWQILNLALSMLFGGYVTSRLSGTHSHLDGELHGVTMWGLATLLGSLLLAHALSGLLGWVAPGVTSAVSHAVGTDAVTSVVPTEILPAAQIDRLQQSLNNSGDPTTMTREQIDAEITSLVHAGIPGGLSDASRARLVSLVAADSGVTRDEALRRVTRMENDARTGLAQAEQKARVAADQVARSTATAARALFTALTIGLLSALIGAWLGTRHKRHLHPVEHAYHPVEHTYHPVEHTYHPVPTTTYHPVEHTTYHPVNTVHEPVYTRPSYEPSSVSVYDDSGQIVSQYLRGVTFPVNKQDLLRLARSRNAGSTLVRSIEQMADGTYANTDEVLRALGKLTA